MGILDLIFEKGEQTTKIVVKKAKDVLEPPVKPNEVFLIAVPARILRLFSVHKPTGDKVYAFRIDMMTKIPGSFVYGDGNQPLQEFLDRNAAGKCIEQVKKKTKTYPKTLKHAKVNVNV